jgi:hypothetical protein
MEAPEGIEPPTTQLRRLALCSDELRGCEWRIGAGRTADLPGFNRALYILSYRPSKWRRRRESNAHTLHQGSAP